METQPIVDRLNREYGDRVFFHIWNARDGGEGQKAFETLRPPGHPSYVIFNLSQIETYRGFGIVPEETLRAAIETALIAE